MIDCAQVSSQNMASEGLRYLCYCKINSDVLGLFGTALAKHAAGLLDTLLSFRGQNGDSQVTAIVTYSL